MAGESSPGNDDTIPVSPDTPRDEPPEKIGLPFYAAMALIGCLVLMVLILNYPAVRAHAGVVMTQTPWTLQSYTNAEGMHVPAIRGNNVTARFGKDGRMGGNAGCNWYAARFTTKDYAINLSLETVTDMACWDPVTSVQERAFLSDLSETASFRVSETSLRFYNASGKTVLVFVPV